MNIPHSELLQISETKKKQIETWYIQHYHEMDDTIEFIAKCTNGFENYEIQTILDVINVNNFGRFMIALFFLHKVNADVTIFKKFYKQHRIMLLSYDIQYYLKKEKCNSWYLICFLSFIIASLTTLYTFTL